MNYNTTIMKKLIAVVDDEEDILELVSIHLKNAGFEAKSFSEGKELFQFLNNHIPQLIVLDLMLPDTDGLEICRILRSDKKFSDIPIIMLTAKGEETDKVVGLELGADDYITKPFSPKEFVARVRAVLRRKERRETKPIIEIGNIKIDLEKYEVSVREKKLELTSTEFKILKILSENEGKVFTREELLDNLWGIEKTVVDRTIDVHIKHLRDKLGSAGHLIKNVRGIGYKIER